MIRGPSRACAKSSGCGNPPRDVTLNGVKGLLPRGIDASLREMLHFVQHDKTADFAQTLGAPACLLH